MILLFCYLIILVVLMGIAIGKAELEWQSFLLIAIWPLSLAGAVLLAIFAVFQNWASND